MRNMQCIRTSDLMTQLPAALMREEVRVMGTQTQHTARKGAAGRRGRRRAARRSRAGAG